MADPSTKVLFDEMRDFFDQMFQHQPESIPTVVAALGVSIAARYPQPALPAASAKRQTPTHPLEGDESDVPAQPSPSPAMPSGITAPTEPAPSKHTTGSPEAKDWQDQMKAALNDRFRQLVQPRDAKSRAKAKHPASKNTKDQPAPSTEDVNMEGQ